MTPVNPKRADEVHAIAEFIRGQLLLPVSVSNRTMNHLLQASATVINNVGVDNAKDAIVACMKEKPEITLPLFIYQFTAWLRAARAKEQR